MQFVKPRISFSNLEVVILKMLHIEVKRQSLLVMVMLPSSK